MESALEVKYPRYRFEFEGGKDIWIFPQFWCERTHGQFPSDSKLKEVLEFYITGTQADPKFQAAQKKRDIRPPIRAKVIEQDTGNVMATWSITDSQDFF